MTLTVEFDREEDGRHIAIVPDMPGVTCYGATREEAFEKVKGLAFAWLSYCIEQGHPLPGDTSCVVFQAA